VTSFVRFSEENITKSNNSKKSESKDGGKVFINGVKSSIIYEKYNLKPDWYTMSINNTKALIQLKKSKSEVLLEKQGDSITLRCKKIDSDFTSSLLDIKIIGKSGYWSLIGYGNISEKELYGVAKIKDMTVKEATAVMNIIAVINTIPALIQFKSPGFTSDGYTIKDGVIDFYYSKEKIFFKAIRIIGTNTDIIGQGSVDLKSKKIDLALSINTIKGLSSFIGGIPLINYILLDEDKTIGTIVKVTGTFDKPIVDTHVATDIILYPFQVLKRIILLPKYLMSDDDEKGEFSE
jgi:hypothetical protein